MNNSNTTLRQEAAAIKSRKQQDEITARRQQIYKETKQIMQEREMLAKRLQKLYEEDDKLCARWKKHFRREEEKLMKSRQPASVRHKKTKKQ